MAKNDLYKRIQDGDEKAFEILFRQYYTVLIRVAKSIVSQTDVAEDIAQKVFTELWLKRKDTQIFYSVEAYLKKAAIFKSIDFVRRQKGSKEKLHQYRYNAPSGMIFSPEELLLQEEKLADIQQKIESLPPKCKEVFQLSRFEQMTYAEIADQLGISKKTVEYHISLAIKLLRESLFLLVFSFLF